MTGDTRQAVSGVKIQNSVVEIQGARNSANTVCGICGNNSLNCVEGIPQMPFGNFVNAVYEIAGAEDSVNSVCQIGDGKDLAITSRQISGMRKEAML